MTRPFKIESPGIDHWYSRGTFGTQDRACAAANQLSQKWEAPRHIRVTLNSELVYEIYRPVDLSYLGGLRIGDGLVEDTVTVLMWGEEDL